MAGTGKSSPDGLPATTFISKTYDEAPGLVVEARDYVRDHARSDARALGLSDGSLLSSETFRRTTRLTEVLAWLLLQRALHAGEITAEEVREESNRLTASDLCLGAGLARLERLPPRLQNLLEPSERLYRRVLRLDELVMRDGA